MDDFASRAEASVESTLPEVRSRRSARLVTRAPSRESSTDTGPASLGVTCFVSTSGPGRQCGSATAALVELQESARSGVCTSRARHRSLTWWADDEDPPCRPQQWTPSVCRGHWRATPRRGNGAAGPGRHSCPTGRWRSCTHPSGRSVGRSRLWFQRQPRIPVFAWRPRGDPGEERPDREPEETREKGWAVAGIRCHYLSEP